MLIKEAIEVLKQMDQNKQVQLIFTNTQTNDDYPYSSKQTTNTNSQFADH